MLEALWRAHRYRLRAETAEARRQLNEFKAAQGLPLGSSVPFLSQDADFKPELHKQSSPQNHIEGVLTLEASLLRSEHDVWSADQTLDAFERWARSHGQIPGAHFHFQRGLNALHRGDYTLAANHFSVARDWFEDSEFRVAAAGNFLVCQIAQGQWKESFLMEYFELRRSMKIPLDPTCHYLILQNKFLRGHLGPEDLELSDSDTGQFAYFKKCLRQLPFLDVSSGGVDRAELPASLFESTYRTRTLLGWLHPDDLRRQAHRQVCDRLYLWFWKWVSTGSASLLAAFLEQLRSLTELEDDEIPFTSEDRHLLEAIFSGLWVLDPSSRATLSQWAQRYFPESTAERSPHFEYERLFWSWVEATIKGNTELAASLHQQISQDSFRLKSYRWSTWTKSPPTFVLDLVPKTQRLKGIHWHHQGIVWKSLFHPSPLLTRAAHKIITCAPNPIPVDSFYQSTFEEAGPSQSNRIQGVLNRLRRIFGPDFAVLQKGDWIYPSSNWAQIPLHGFHSATRQLQTHPTWKQIIQVIQNDSPTIGNDWEPIFVRLPRVFSRRDISRLSSKSKATICRWLEEARSEGIIQSNGFGKQTRYIKLRKSL